MLVELNGLKRLPWNEGRWAVAVKCSDYDSFTSISRIAGNPDLEYMLRLNQIMINFVKDKQRDEYVPMFICYVDHTLSSSIYYHILSATCTVKEFTCRF